MAHTYTYEASALFVKHVFATYHITYIIKNASRYINLVHVLAQIQRKK